MDAPQRVQKTAAASSGWLHAGHDVVIGLGEATGWDPDGVAPRRAEIMFAWAKLNSRTRPGIRKHSTKPQTAGMPVQKKTA